MSFSFEMGRNKILRYHFEQNDVFDNEQLEALYSIKSKHFLDVQKIFRDGDTYLEYDITAHLSLGEYIARLIEHNQYNVDKAADIIIGIINSIMDVEKYFSLTVDNIVIEFKHIYWDMSESVFKFVYLPLEEPNSDLKDDFSNFIKELEYSSEDNSEVIAFYIVQLNYLRECDFEFQKFKDYLEEKRGNKSSKTGNKNQAVEQVQVLPQAHIQEQNQYVNKNRYVGEKEEPKIQEYAQPSAKMERKSILQKKTQASAPGLSKSNVQASVKENKIVSDEGFDENPKSKLNTRTLILLNFAMIILAGLIAKFVFVDDKGQLDLVKVAGLIVMVVAIGNYILMKLGYFSISSDAGKADSTLKTKADNLNNKNSKKQKNKVLKKGKMAPGLGDVQPESKSVLKSKSPNPPVENSSVQIPPPPARQSVEQQNFGYSTPSRLNVNPSENRVELVGGVTNQNNFNPHSYEVDSLDKDYMEGTQMHYDVQHTEFLPSSVQGATGVSLFLKSKMSTLPIHRFPCIVGRVAERSDVVVSTPSVSGVHVRIEEHDSRYYVIDLGSKNGTTINGAKIKSKELHELRDGDLLSLSSEELIFKINR